MCVCVYWEGKGGVGGGGLSVTCVYISSDSFDVGCFSLIMKRTRLGPTRENRVSKTAIIITIIITLIVVKGRQNLIGASVTNYTHST